MEHLSFDIICRIADGDIVQNEIALYLNHLKSCRSCQREVDLQRSIVKASRQSKLIRPSTDFSKNVLAAIRPSQEKKWYEWILHNMGNIFAMATVLAFLGYVFSVTGSGTLQNDKPTKIEPILDFFKIIQNGTQQLGSYLTPKITSHNMDSSQGHVILFAFLAIILLLFLDKIAGYFLQRSKVRP
jgi:hypothetical protein